MNFQKINPFAKAKENLDNKNKEELVSLVTTTPCYEWKSIKNGKEQVVLLSPDEMAMIISMAIIDGTRVIKEYEDDLPHVSPEILLHKLVKYITTKEALVGKLSRKVALAEAYEAFEIEKDNYEFDFLSSTGI